MCPRMHEREPEEPERLHRQPEHDERPAMPQAEGAEAVRERAEDELEDQGHEHGRPRPGRQPLLDPPP